MKIHAFNGFDAVEFQFFTEFSVFACFYGRFLIYTSYCDDLLTI